MNALKSAIAGLTLLSGATLVRADVITDWTQTAIDVMKAVNVAGNPWTRTLAMMQVSMSDSINAVQDQGGEPVPSGCAAEAIERSLCARLQRGQGSGRAEEREADRRAVRRGAVLVARQFFCLVVPGRRADLGPQGPRAGRQRAPVRAALHGHRQLLHPRLGRQVHLPVLAAAHGDPQRRPGRQ